MRDRVPDVPWFLELTSRFGRRQRWTCERSFTSHQALPLPTADSTCLSSSSPPPIDVLYELRQTRPELFSEIEVWVDGGIRRGSDVLKGASTALAHSLARYQLTRINVPVISTLPRCKSGGPRPAVPLCQRDARPGGRRKGHHPCVNAPLAPISPFAHSDASPRMVFPRYFGSHEGGDGNLDAPPRRDVDRRADARDGALCRPRAGAARRLAGRLARRRRSCSLIRGFCFRPAPRLAKAGGQRRSMIERKELETKKYNAAGAAQKRSRDLRQTREG